MKKKQWGYWNNYLIGIPWGRWRALLRENRVDPPYRPRARLLTVVSLKNSVERLREERQFGAVIARTRVEEAPVFVLGHWRSGTTHLHNLLACDREQFAAPTSIQVSYPYSFLSTETAIRKQFLEWVPETRPMDGVALGPDTPQEDEFAMCVSCLRSPFLGMASFPRRADHYDRYLTFAGVAPQEVAEWKSSFDWFLRKLTVRHGRRLLLKSPTHTARIRLLLELFPDARFVHVHRDPYAVFRSTQHLFRSLWPINVLQAPPPDTDERILRRYSAIYDSFLAERELIPEGQFHEVAYDDVVADPLGQVRVIYERFRLSGYERIRPELERYVASLGDYRRNPHTELPSAQRDQVRSAWRKSFEVWDYPA